MTLVDVISYFDKIRPNTFEFAVKKDWVFKIETDLKEFAVIHTKKNPDMSFVSEENPELFLLESEKDIYVYYMASMADLTNGEYSLYNISSTYFNGLMSEWKKKYRCCNTPENTKRIKV